MATARVGRTGRVGRQARVMAHSTRRKLAPSPDDVVARVASVVGAAFQRWADRFVGKVLRDIVPHRFASRADGAEDRAELTPFSDDDASVSFAVNGAYVVCGLECFRVRCTRNGAEHLHNARVGRDLAVAGVNDVEHNGALAHADDERPASADLERFVQDATVQVLFEEAGSSDPDRDALEEAFRLLDKQSADETRVTGVRTADTVPEGPKLQQQFIRANTDLIKAEADLRRRVERVIADPLNEGRSVGEIAKLLEEQVGYAKSRAELTARDQTLKLYGQLQEARQTAAGITRYVWTTSLDERVRPDHADLDGTVQEWSSPPIVDKRTGRRGHPGFDFQCRCTAVPVLDDEASEPAPAAEQRAARERAVAEGRFVPPAQRPPPPREPAMRPTSAELEIQRATLERERARAEAERAADVRVAQQRALADVHRSVAPFTGDEMVQGAEELTRNRRVAQTVAEAEASAAAERAVAGKSLDDLGAIPFTSEDLQTDASLRWLRTSDFFKRTGNVEDNFGRSKGGLPQITIAADGSVYLSNGRHRLTVARELGLRQIQARVRKLGPKGGQLWEYVGLIQV